MESDPEEIHLRDSILISCYTTQWSLWALSTKLLQLIILQAPAWHTNWILYMVSIGHWSLWVLSKEGFWRCHCLNFLEVSRNWWHCVCIQRSLLVSADLGKVFLERQSLTLLVPYTFISQCNISLLTLSVWDLYGIEFETEYSDVLFCPQFYTN